MKRKGTILIVAFAVCFGILGVLLVSALKTTEGEYVPPDVAATIVIGSASKEVQKLLGSPSRILEEGAGQSWIYEGRKKLRSSMGGYPLFYSDWQETRLVLAIAGGKVIKKVYRHR